MFWIVGAAWIIADLLEVNGTAHYCLATDNPPTPGAKIGVFHAWNCTAPNRLRAYQFIGRDGCRVPYCRRRDRRAGISQKPTKRSRAKTSTTQTSSRRSRVRLMRAPGYATVSGRVCPLVCGSKAYTVCIANFPVGAEIAKCSPINRGASLPT